MSQSTYDPGPVPPPTERDRIIARRIRAIAALHAMAQWFTDHPDAPLPWSVELNMDPATDPAAPDAERVAAMESFAQSHGAEQSRHGPHLFAELRLAGEQTHGVNITAIMSTTIRDKR